MEGTINATDTIVRQQYSFNLFTDDNTFARAGQSVNKQPDAGGADVRGFLSAIARRC